MMTNKYLKYHPYITREVFGDIINSLNKEYSVKFNIDAAYKLFSELNYLIVLSHIIKEITLIPKVPIEFEPISWTTILGKDYILKLANEHYPIDTKYYSVNNDSLNQVKKVFNYYSFEDCITDGCGGRVYSKGKWADKVKQYKTVSHPEYPALTTFPQTGLCLDKLDNLLRLVEYLNDRPTRRVDKLLNIPVESIGIAWNETSCWIIKEKSSKPNYLFNQLEEFIKPTKELINSTAPKIIIEDGKFVGFEEQNSSDSKFKLYDWVMIKESYLPITENWLGEGGKITHQGAYQITEIKNNHVRCLNNIKCTLGFDRFRFATKSEIDEALRILKHKHYVDKMKHIASISTPKHKKDDSFTDIIDCIFGTNKDSNINTNSFDNPNQITVPKKATIKVEVNQEVKINIPVKSKIKI